jgi:hypothetical protein
MSASNAVSEFGATSAALVPASDFTPAAIVRIKGARRARIVTGIVASVLFQDAVVAAKPAPYVGRLMLGQGDIRNNTSLLYGAVETLNDNRISKVQLDTPVEHGKPFVLMFPDASSGIFIPAGVDLFAVLGAIQTADGQDPVKTGSARLTVYGRDIEEAEKFAGFKVR